MASRVVKLFTVAAISPMLAGVLSVAGGASASFGSGPPADPGPPPVAYAERPVCGPPASGHVRCFAHILETGATVRPDLTNSSGGLSPAKIKGAYGFSTDPAAGTGTTIAIVDAYDDPTAQADLNTFSNQYGLPACGSTCFTKYVSNGTPPVDQGWALEISLDIEWAHAIAPGAHIALVEAASSSYGDLLPAEDFAASIAGYVTNSWGGSESFVESAYDSHFAQPSVSYFVSAGDAGATAQYPSTSPNVISVGGTTLNLDPTTGAFVSETAWSGGGGGCSSYESATSAQSHFSQYGQVNCGGRRATPDVALDADPNTGVSVYDSTPYNNQTGWWIVGGTSASAPMWAGRSAASGAVVNSARVYGTAIPFRDITSGNNGAPALVGYDLASGRGSWNDGPPPASPPGAPTLTATAGAGSVSLSWTPTGAAATSYSISKGTAAGGENQNLATVTSTTYTDTAVTAGSTYYYTVTASNASGPSAPSNEASATVAADELPTVTITKGCNGGTTCTFTANASDPDGSINAYKWSTGSSSSSITMTYSTKGTQPTVTVTVTDSAAQTNSASTSVTCTFNKRQQRLVCS